jgi:hypothetical protein
MASRAQKPAGKAQGVTAKGDKIGVDLRALPAPSQHFVADHAWVQLRSGIVGLGFGALTLGRERHIAARLEIRMSVEAFAGSVLGPIDALLTGLQKYLESTPRVPRASPEEWVREAPTDKDSLAWATLVRVAHVGGEAQLDFYQLTASQVANAVNGQKIEQFEVIPVLRVLMAAFELHGLLVDSINLGQQLGLRGAQ